MRHYYPNNDKLPKSLATLSGHHKGKFYNRYQRSINKVVAKGQTQYRLAFLNRKLTNKTLLEQKSSAPN